MKFGKKKILNTTGQNLDESFLGNYEEIQEQTSLIIHTLLNEFHTITKKINTVKNKLKEITNDTTEDAVSVPNRLKRTIDSMYRK